MYAYEELRQIVKHDRETVVGLCGTWTCATFHQRGVSPLLEPCDSDRAMGLLADVL